MTRKSKIARLRREGWAVLEGAYHGTSDDRIGRWYAHKRGQLIAKFGEGYATRSAVWDVIIRHIEALE